MRKMEPLETTNELGANDNWQSLELPISESSSEQKCWSHTHWRIGRLTSPQQKLAGKIKTRLENEAFHKIQMFNYTWDYHITFFWVIVHLSSLFSNRDSPKKQYPWLNKLQVANISKGSSDVFTLQEIGVKLFLGKGTVGRCWHTNLDA